MHTGISTAYCRANGLSVFVRKAFVYSQTALQGCGRKGLGDFGVKLPRLFEAKGFPFPTKDTSRGVQIQSRSFRSSETPFRATMGSEPRRSGFRDPGKDNVPSVPPRLMDESEYPPLSASSSKAIRNSSGKGKDRLSAEQDHAHAPSKPQQLTQGVPRDTEATERQRDFYQNRESGDSDGREAGDGHGAETGSRLETGDRRGGWKNDRGHSYVSEKRQQLTQRGSGFGEGTERQENLNQNRQSADHDRYGAGDRDGDEVGKGRETGERRNGWKNDQVHHTYVSSRSQQRISRASEFTENTERQRNSNQDRQSDDLDGRGFREGTERQRNSNQDRQSDDLDRRAFRVGTERHRNSNQDRQSDDHGRRGFREGTERQRNSNQDRPSDDHDRSGFRVGTERQRNSNQDRPSDDHDRRGSREGTERQRNPNQDRPSDDHDRRGSREGTERQRNPNQDRPSDDLDRRGFREGTERQRNSNQNRQSVYHDRPEADNRQDATWEIIDALGRTMARILRHQAAELNLKMSNDGYVNVRDILKLPMKTRAKRPLSSHNIDDVKQAVQEDNKQRFGIKEENGQLFIRANQGHSLETVITEHLLKPIVCADEIPVCVHGTYRRALDQIFEQGLKRMERNHVHFATGVLGSDGVISGMRASVQVLIYLNVDKALADGMKFYMSENRVILTEGFEGVVPPQYFKEVLALPDMRPIAPRPRRA